MSRALFLACLAGLLPAALPPDVRADDLRAPVEPLARRVQEAQKVFVGVLVNRKDLEGDWCHADLKVTRPIKGVQVGELVPVLWRPRIARFDARENQTGLAVLKHQHDKRYWLRPDTFADAKLAEEAIKALDKPGKR